MENSNNTQQSATCSKKNTEVLRAQKTIPNRVLRAQKRIPECYGLKKEYRSATCSKKDDSEKQRSGALLPIDTICDIR